MEYSNLVDEGGGEEFDSIEAVLKLSNSLALGKERGAVGLVVCGECL